jgi:pimeloyl-ACP methyl ester carboxylesterase
MGDATMWGRDLEANPATKEFQLIAVDLRGHGKSDKPHDKDKYGPEMAEDVVRLLDHLKLPKAHLVGYSMGAYVAGGVAAKYPDRVLSVVYGGQAPIIAGTLLPLPDVPSYVRALFFREFSKKRIRF